MPTTGLDLPGATVDSLAMAHTKSTDICVCSWLAVIVTALVLPGCGGSSKPAPSNVAIAGATTSTESSPSDSSAITRADAICERLDAELAAKPAKSVSVKEIETITPQNAALEQKAVNELAKLTAPKAIEREWQQVIAYRRSLASALIQLAQAAKAGDTASIKRLGQAKERVRKKLLEVGEHAGFTHCQELG
jgi:hypothetical protein